MKDNLDKHRRYVEILKERQVEVRKIKTFFAPPSKMPKDLIREDDALQYFIGVGERMTKENIEQVLGKIEMPIDESWCELKETSNPAVVILKNKWTGMIIQAILTSLTGEVINAKQD